MCCAGVERVDRGKLKQVMSWSVHDKLCNLAMNDFELMIRLASARDAIAGDVLYHGLCLLDDEPGVSGSSNSKNVSHDIIMQQVVRELQYRICRGQRGRGIAL